VVFRELSSRIPSNARHPDLSRTATAAGGRFPRRRSNEASRPAAWASIQTAAPGMRLRVRPVAGPGSTYATSIGRTRATSHAAILMVATATSARSARTAIASAVVVVDLRARMTSDATTTAAESTRAEDAMTPRTVGTRQTCGIIESTIDQASARPGPRCGPVRLSVLSAFSVRLVRQDDLHRAGVSHHQKWTGAPPELPPPRRVPVAGAGNVAESFVYDDGDVPSTPVRPPPTCGPVALPSRSTTLSSEAGRPSSNTTVPVNRYARLAGGSISGASSRCWAPSS
jgi:hypothetical protein